MNDISRFNVKIIHIVGNSSFGGGSVIIIELAKLAVKNGWHVDILTTDKIMQEAIQKENIDIGIVDLNVIWSNIKPIRDLIGLYRLYKFLRDENYTIVHTHTSKAGFVGRIAAKLAGIPNIIHTVHGFAFHEYSKYIIVKIYTVLEKIASLCCDKIVTVSEYHKGVALKLKIGNKDKTVCVPNGISENRVRSVVSSDTLKINIGLDPKEFIIMCLGRLTEQKGMEYLIRAIPLINKSIETPFKLLIAGDGPLRVTLEQLSHDLNVSDKVCFIGFQGDVSRLLNISDIIVMPSLWEGLSISLLEAMAAKKTIIATCIGSNVEVTENGKSAILVKPKSSYEIAKAIEMLICNIPLARKYSEQARKRYSVCYTDYHMARGYNTIYLELLSRYS